MKRFKSVSKGLKTLNGGFLIVQAAPLEFVASEKKFEQILEIQEILRENQAKLMKWKKGKKFHGRFKKI